jgi:predicted nucleic acid-binding protein
MIVADTSALISLASVGLLEAVLVEYHVHTAGVVVNELEETADYEDRHADAAATGLDHRDRFTSHEVDTEFTSSRVDRGEGDCALLTRELDAEFLVTDDLRALPELRNVSSARVAISPVLLRALVKRDRLEEREARETLEELAANRDWLGAPIYRRALERFE